MADLGEVIEILKEVRSDIRLAKCFSAMIIAVLLVIIVAKLLSP
ncbi:MAG: hypothetical protein QXT92_00045 [Nitrososphaerota archaeon]